MGWTTGLEPATSGITIRGSTNWATPTIEKVLLPDSHKMVRPAGFEPATTRLEGGCSIQLSYGRYI